MAAPTPQAADFSNLDSLPAFEKQYREYSASPSFAQLAPAAFRHTFTAQFDSLVLHCADWSELQRLQAFSEKTLRTSGETDASPGGQCILAVNSAHRILCSLNDREKTDAVMAKAGACESILRAETLQKTPCLAQVMALLRKQWLEDEGEALAQRPFPVRLAVCLVCGFTAGGAVDWREVIGALCPGYGSMLRPPFALKNIDLFRTLRSMLALLALQTDAAGARSAAWAASLASFLNTGSEFADYSARVRASKKALRTYLPNLREETGPKADALRLWLTP